MPHDQKAAFLAAPVKTILVVEDDTGIAEFLSLAIAQETPYFPLIVADGSEALHAMQHIAPSLLIIDYLLPHMNGLELYDLFQTEGREVPPTIIISASVEQLIEELKERHLVGLSKPLELTDFLHTIEQVLTARAEVPLEPEGIASNDD